MVVITCAQSQLLISWTNQICWIQGLIDNTVNKTVILICLCYIVFYMLITLLHDSRYIILYHGRCGRDRRIYNYLCNQCLSQLNVWVWIKLMMRCTWYNIMWWSLSVTCDRSVVFCVYSGFIHQYNWLLQYNWNIVESGVKHHSPNHNPSIVLLICFYFIFNCYQHECHLSVRIRTFIVNVK